MKIEQVITMASPAVRLQFQAMERSLRATGCDLPLLVIPYDESRFPLPKNAEWWDVPEIRQWLARENAQGLKIKYQTLTKRNFFYADTDICFLRNPVDILAPFSGLVAADTEWNKPRFTYTPQSEAILSKKSSVWLRRIFNTGFFACDRVCYEPQELIRVASDPAHIETCVRLRYNEQHGINLLVGSTDIEITNLTMPPYWMESTMAVDYPGEYEHLWSDPTKKPIFIHWAGRALDNPRPINEIFYQFLTAEERKEWDAEQARRLKADTLEGRWPIGLRVIGALIKRFYPRYGIKLRIDRYGFDLG